MTQISANHPLVTRINALRGRVRVLLFMYGMGLTLLALLGGFATLVLGDYILNLLAVTLSAGTRVALSLAFLIGVGALAWFKLVLPLTTRLTDQFLASRVENVDASLADELISAVHFIRSDLPEKNILARKAIEAAETRAAGVRFEDSLDYSAALRALAAAGVVALAMAALAFAAPAFAKTGLQRWLTPYAGVTWPKTTDVAIEWPNGQPPAVHPLGDPLRIRAKVTRGGYEGMRVFVYSSSDTQREVRDLMNYQEALSNKDKGEYVFQKDLEPGDASAYYVHVVAGDDREPTQKTSAKIRLAPRPMVTAASAVVAPPAYVKNPADAEKPADVRNYNMLEEIARAVEGSTVRMLVRSSKPIARDPQGQPLVSFLEAGNDKPLVIPGMARKTIDANTAELTWRAAKSADTRPTTLEFRPIITDTDGFENRVSPTIRMEIVSDSQPSVIILEPKGQMTVKPDAVLNVKIQATDDLGLDEIILQADAFDAKPEDAPVFRKALKWGTPVVDAANQRISSTAEFTWDLKELNLKEGQRLTFYALVRDNFSVPADEFTRDIARPFEAAANKTVRHEMVKSAALILQIKSEAEIMDMVRNDLQAIKEQIKSLHGQQTETNDRTKAIQKMAAETGATTEQQKNDLARLATEQSTQAQRANAIKDRLDQVKESLKTNKLEESDLGKTTDEAAKGMEQVGKENMPKAAGELGKAQESAAKSPQQPSSQEQKDAQKSAASQVADSAAKADQEQEKALATMQNLMDKLDQTGAVSKARSEIEDILKQQKENLKDIRQTAKDLLNSDRMTPEQKKKLDDIAAEQEKLAARTSKAISEMEKDAKKLAQSDPASAESLSKAAEKGKDNKVPAQQGGAGQAAKEGKMSESASSAGSAQKGLEEMKDELDKLDHRKLEQLARELEDLLNVITKHREDQAAIKGETEKAGEEAKATALKPLGDREDRLQGNTLSTRTRAAANPKLRGVASDLKTAADAMISATVELFKGQGPQSIKPQDDALAALDKALEKLKEEKKKVDEQLKDKDLAAFRKEYEAIKAKQEELKTETDAIAKRKETRGELMRPDLLKLGAHATSQGELSGKVDDLSKDEKLSKYDVIVFINSQITDAMGDAKGRLSKAQVGTQVASAQQTAIDRLDDIINALKEEQDREKDPFEKPDSGGGSGSGGGGKPPLIPPVAQLKLLKALQTVVNTDTTRTHKGIQTAAEEAAKTELKEKAVKLGQQQDKIHDIAKKVVDSLKQ